MTISVWTGLSLAFSVSGLVYVLTTTRRIAKQRDEATEAADRWMRLYFDAELKLRERAKIVNSSPFPEGMTQAEYFGLTSEKAEKEAQDDAQRAQIEP